MKLFIAYSGETAKRLAEEIRKWLPGMLPGLQPYFAKTDIKKGSDWRDAIGKAATKAGATMLCLTQEGMNRPWINYEAGLSARVFPVLFGDAAGGGPSGPLEAFQATMFEKDDMLRLMHDLNGLTPKSGRTSSELERHFKSSWPKLEQAVSRIIASSSTDVLKQIEGGWWERISTKEVTAISFLQIERDPGRKTLRLLGAAYGLDGRPTATWASEIVLVDPDRAMLAYLWEGEYLAGPSEKRRGIGQIFFFKSPGGRLESGQGAFDDTNMRDFYTTKKFRLVRATRAEQTVMTGHDDSVKTALVKKRLRKMA